MSGVWYGYDKGYKTVPTGTYYGTAQLWKNIFGDIAEQGTRTEFPECKTVQKLYFCSNTGDIASNGCPTYNYGYYKSDFANICRDGTRLNDKNLPGYGTDETEEEEENEEEESE